MSAQRARRCRARLVPRTGRPGVAAAPRRGRGSAGVCLLGDNVVDADQLAALIARLRSVRDGVVIALDEEGGDVTRLEAAPAARTRATPRSGAIDDLDADPGGRRVDRRRAGRRRRRPRPRAVRRRQLRPRQPGHRRALVRRRPGAGRPARRRVRRGLQPRRRRRLRQALPRPRRHVARLAPGAARGRRARSTCCAHASWCRSAPPSRPGSTP